jgi:hypothetical protein
MSHSFYKKSINDFGKTSKNFSRKLLVVAVFWLSAIATSLAFIGHYSNIPGLAGLPPALWPVDSQIALDDKLPTLIMFAHPRCPCTRASISELEQLMSDCRGQLNAQVWFIKPGGTADDWTDTDLRHSAAAIPGVKVYTDNDGNEAHRFQSETSGQTVLYGKNGQLLFHGGITISRGHAGDNPGLNALEALVTHKIFNPIQAPVFGCLLYKVCTNPNKIGDAQSKQ